MTAVTAWLLAVSPYVALYLAGGFVLLGLMALLDRHGARSAFWCSLLWPLVLVSIPLAMAVESSPWRFDVVRNDCSPWGFRRPDDGHPGWAVRCPWFEFQTWSTRK